MPERGNEEDDGGNTGGSFHQAVGELVSATATVELAGRILLWGLVGVTQQVGEIVLPDSLPRMLPLIRQLAQLRIEDDDMRATVLRWADEVKPLYEQRNKLIHRVILGTDDDSVHMMMPKRMGVGQIEEVTAADVRAIAQRMEGAGTTGAAFLGPLSQELPGPWQVF